MPLFSCFSPFGQLEFSSAPSEAEKIYSSLVHAYRDPKSGQVTIDTSQGTHQEAKLYGWSMALGGARAMLRRAGNELRPETSYSQLEAHEVRFRMSPAADDTVSQRRSALAAKQKAARGPRYEAIVEALASIYGSLLIAYRPVAIGEAEPYPVDPGQPSAPGLFRRPDAVAKSVRILTAITRTGEPFDLADSYDSAHADDAIITTNTSATSGAAQSFTGNGGALSMVRFFLAEAGSPTGTAVAKIYAHGGTYGTSSVPVGAALATSAPFDVSVLTASYVLYDLSFYGANQIVLKDGTHYVLTLEYNAGSASEVDVGTDSSAPIHAGNSATFAGGVWTPHSAVDVCFEIYTGYPMQVSYENWNRSLVESLIVKGDVLVVDPGNWGLAEKIVVTAADGEGADRLLTAVFRKPHSANVYGTTGPMPMWTNSKRHVLVVVTAAAAVDPAMVVKTNDLFRRMMRGPTTWAIVQPTTPGASTTGPFVLGSTMGSPLGAVPVESLGL